MDKYFLQQLDKNFEKDIYVRIIALDMNDLPLETIEGKVTSGSINIDGSSAVRRTCSISLIAPLKDTVITDSNWCFNTKIKLQIGQKNTITEDYPNIIWFDQGIFIISSFNVSYNVNSISVSLQGKDKMCRLNGEISGNLFADTDFGQEEKYDKETNTTTLIKIPIKNIIRWSLKQYGQELDKNIIINDLEEYGYDLWEYRGETPLYYFMEINGNIQFMTLDGDLMVKDENNIDIKISEISRYYSTNTLDPQINKNATKIFLSGSSKQYYIIKIDSDETAGHHRRDLVYNTDLILKAGETLTSLLDKLVSMLGNYEYFYDLYGRFVFQKKNNYIQELYATSSGALTMPLLNNNYYSYKFEDESMFTSVSFAPNIINIKNDFIVWGQRTSASGETVPIHARCAIDKRPVKYITPWPEERNFGNSGFYTNSMSLNLFDKEVKRILDEDNKKLNSTEHQYDWRELIYQMALDFNKHNQDSDYLIQIEKFNPEFKNGHTGYEQYYTDLLGFWRQLYCPPEDYDHNDAIGNEYYVDGDKQYWNKQIHTNPSTLNFWFEFLDTNGELSQYAISKIGDRTKVINENSITSIYYSEIPEVQFVIAPDEKPDDIKTSNIAYTTLQITENDKELFARSAQGMSAIEKINELIYNHTATIQNINISSIPIFYLQPNTRIYIPGETYYGDYNIDRLTFNLNYSGTMSISATKILKQFI